MAFQTLLSSICLKCGAKCCKYDSPIIFPEERKRIIKFSGKDYFKKQGDYYVIPREPCPYLTKDNLCSINKIKPIDCQAYPVGIMRKKGKLAYGISQECPAKFSLSNTYISKARKILDKLSTKQKNDYITVSEFYKFDIR